MKNKKEPEISELSSAREIKLVLDHDDAALFLYVQAEGDDLTDRAKIYLLHHLISPGFFSSLRTDQQLGYVVAAVNSTIKRKGGLGFIIQSPVAGPSYLRSRITDYLKEENARLAYTKVRNQVDIKVRTCKRQYEKLIAMKTKTQPRMFWAHTRRKMKSKSGIAPSCQRLFQLSQTIMVKDKLNQINPNKSCGPDDIHPRLLREVAEYISEPISLLMNMSLDQSAIPNDWKNATICPVFKKGSPRLPVNYRPISLTCILCKMLESFVREPVMKHLLDNNYFQINSTALSVVDQPQRSSFSILTNALKQLQLVEL